MTHNVKARFLKHCDSLRQAASTNQSLHWSSLTNTQITLVI